MSTITKQLISTSNAPRPIAPFNHAVVANRTVYVSGCIGIDKNTMKLVGNGAQEQTEKALENLRIVLEAAGSGVDKVIKNTIYVKDLNDFGIINEIYEKFFQHEFPARSCIQVARLPMDALIEIESIALVGDVKTEWMESKL